MSDQINNLINLFKCGRLSPDLLIKRVENVIIEKSSIKKEDFISTNNEKVNNTHRLNSENNNNNGLTSDIEHKDNISQQSSFTEDIRKFTIETEKYFNDNYTSDNNNHDGIINIDRDILNIDEFDIQPSSIENNNNNNNIWNHNEQIQHENNQFDISNIYDIKKSSDSKLGISSKNLINDQPDINLSLSNEINHSKSPYNIHKQHYTNLLSNEKKPEGKSTMNSNSKLRGSPNIEKSNFKRHGKKIGSEMAKSAPKLLGNNDQQKPKQENKGKSQIGYSSSSTRPVSKINEINTNQKIKHQSLIDKYLMKINSKIIKNRLFIDQNKPIINFDDSLIINNDSKSKKIIDFDTNTQYNGQVSGENCIKGRNIVTTTINSTMLNDNLKQSKILVKDDDPQYLNYETDPKKLESPYIHYDNDTRKLINNPSNKNELKLVPEVTLKSLSILKKNHIDNIISSNNRGTNIHVYNNANKKSGIIKIIDHTKSSAQLEKTTPSQEKITHIIDRKRIKTCVSPSKLGIHGDNNKIFTFKDEDIKNYDLSIRKSQRSTTKKQDEIKSEPRKKSESEKGDNVLISPKLIRAKSYTLNRLGIENKVKNYLSKLDTKEDLKKINKISKSDFKIIPEYLENTSKNGITTDEYKLISRLSTNSNKISENHKNHKNIDAYRKKESSKASIHNKSYNQFSPIIKQHQDQKNQFKNMGLDLTRLDNDINNKEKKFKEECGLYDICNSKRDISFTRRYSKDHHNNHMLSSLSTYFPSPKKAFYAKVFSTLGEVINRNISHEILQNSNNYSSAD